VRRWFAVTSTPPNRFCSDPRPATATTPILPRSCKHFTI
jgi:hypothetical protein